MLTSSSTPGRRLAALLGAVRGTTAKTTALWVVGSTPNVEGLHTELARSLSLSPSPSRRDCRQSSRMTARSCGYMLPHSVPNACDLQGQPIWWCRCGETFKNNKRFRLHVALNSVGVGSQRIKCAGAAILATLCGLVVPTLPAHWGAVSLATALAIALRVYVIDVAQRPTSYPGLTPRERPRVTMTTSRRLRQAEGHVDYDASTAPCLRAFRATKAQTLCPFARRATLWGGHHTPASLEQNVAASVGGTVQCLRRH